MPNIKRKVSIFLLLVALVALFLLTFISFQSDKTKILSNKAKQNIVANADVSGGGTASIMLSTDPANWYANGSVRQYDYPLSSAYFSSSNVSYYRTKNSKADHGVTPGTGSFTAGETEKHQLYSPVLTVVVWLELDDNLTAIAQGSTLTATFGASVSGDKNLRWGIFATSDKASASSESPDYDIKTTTATSTNKFLRLSFRTNSGTWYTTKISVSNMTLRLTTSDTTSPSATMSGTTNVSGVPYSNSGAAGFSVSDSGVGISTTTLERREYGSSSWGTVNNYSLATLTLNNTGQASHYAEYRVKVTDRVGNYVTSQYFRHWLPTLRTTEDGSAAGTLANSITGGTQYINDSNTSSGSSLVRRPGQTFYLRAQPSLGYLFDGFTVSIAKINSSLTQTNIGYNLFSYDNGTFYYAITLDATLLNNSGPPAQIGFKANFIKDAVAVASPQVAEYDALEHPLEVNNTAYVTISGAIGTDREVIVTGYKVASGSWTTSVAKLAGKYDVRVVVRKKTDTAIIYGTFELLEVLDIRRKALRIEFDSADKQYDGTTNAALTKLILHGAIASDNLQRTGGTATFDNKNVGSNKTVTASGFGISGSNLSSYKYTSNANIDIGPYIDLGGSTNLGTLTVLKSITRYDGISVALRLKAAHANKTKVYDASNIVDESWFEPILSGVLGSDDVSVATAVYPTARTYTSISEADGKNVGSHYFRSLDIKLTGSDMFNYAMQGKNVTAIATFIADSQSAPSNLAKIVITPKPLGILVTANPKIYDGTVTASGGVALSPSYITGVGDVIVFNEAAIVYSFDNKNVGTEKTVTATNITIDSANSAGVQNYSISLANNTATASIYVRQITATMTCGGKVYDGTVNVSPSSLSIKYSGIVASDGNVSTGEANPSALRMAASVIFAYSSPNVGTGIMVSSATPLVLAGTSAGNYSLSNSSLETTANITQKNLVGNSTISTGGDIIYDGVPHQDPPMVRDTALSANLIPYTDFTFSYNQQPLNYGTYTVTVQGAGNYTGTLTTTMRITKASITLAVDNITVVYGTTVDANSIVGTAVNTTAPTLSVPGAFSFDGSTPMPNTPRYVDSGIYSVRFTINSSQSQNYIIPSPISLTLTVNKKNINVTATDKEQVFGEAPQNLTYTSVDPALSSSDGIVGNDILDVTLACVKNIPSGKVHALIGSYLITREPTDETNSNYNITFTSGTYTITPRPIIITPVTGQNKIYGTGDPVYAYTPSDTVQLGNPLTSVLSDRPLVGVLSREDSAFIGGTGDAGRENVGQYRIIQNTLTQANNANYDLRFSTTTVSFEIVRRIIQISAPSLSQIYGEPILSFDYIVTSGELVGTDTLVGSFSRTINAQSTEETSSVNAGTYVLKDSLTFANAFSNAPKNPNYNITKITNGSYTILPRPLTVTPNSGQTKTYGDADPVFEYTLSYTGNSANDALIGTDRLLGALSRQQGNNVGTYNITKGTLSQPNYTLTMSSEIFTITRKAIIVTAKTWIVDYAQPVVSDSLLTWITSPETLPYGNTLSGSLTLPQSWQYDSNGYIPVGSYDIAQGTVDNSNNPNYSITFNGTNKYVVNMLVANIKPINGQQATYGKTLQEIVSSGIGFTAYTNGGKKIAASYFSGSLSLNTTSTTPVPSSYNIVVGTLTSSTHEIIMNRDINDQEEIVDVLPTPFVINKRPISIQPVTTSQVFGEDEVTTIEYTIVLGSLVNPDELTGNLQSPGSNLAFGDYSVLIGTVFHPYYNISLVNNDRSYKVTKRPITINPNPATSEYGSPNESEITYTVVLTSGFTSSYPALVNGYSLLGKLSRADLHIRNVGSYEIVLGNISNSNYQITLSATKVYYTITKRPLTVRADNKQQIFGNAAITLTYSFVGSQRPAPWDNGLSTSTLLERDPGMIVGAYTITEGNMLDPFVNPNYNITFQSGTYTILPRPITITPVANQTKEYGSEDPTIQYTVSGTSGGVVDGYPLTGVLEREEGELTGSYRIYQGTINNESNSNPNYTITFNSFVSFAITQASSVITFNDSTTLVVGTRYVLDLTYSSAVQSVDASLNHTETNILYSISNSFRDAGTYEITLNVLATRNYKATSATVQVNMAKYELSSIPKTELVDTLENLTKIYGSPDATLQKTIAGLGSDGNIVVVMTRTSGENAGLYDVSIASISSSNYSVELASEAGIEAFEITKRSITISEIATSTKVYDGVATGQSTINYASGYLNDTIVITVNKATGKNVGSYNISSYSIDENSQVNYSVIITDLTDKFIVTKRPVYVTATAISIQYGDANVPLSFSIRAATENTGLVVGENLVGALVRDAGNEAGLYAILQGTLNAENNPNYNINYVGASYTITRVRVKVTPDAKTVGYGNTPEALTYTLDRPLIGTDSLEGELSRLDTRDAGEYDINQGTIDNQDGRNKNYQITYTANIKYTITPRNLTIVPSSAEQVYGESVIPVEYQITAGNLAYDETSLAGNLGRSGSDVGVYDITIGTLASLNPNYNISLENNTGKYVITKRNITVTADPISQIYGNIPLPLTYTITTGSLVAGDDLSYELDCDGRAAQQVGRYAISGDNIYNTNYQITYVGAQYTILPRPLTITILDQESEYKENETDLPFNPASFEITEGTLTDSIEDLNIVITKDPGNQMGTYFITGTHDNANYSVIFLEGIYTIHKYFSTITVNNTILSFLFDGSSKHIDARCDSGAQIKFSIEGVEVNNAFINPGRYNLTLTAPELPNHYAPEEVKVTLTILNRSLSTETSGTQFEVAANEGFAPDLTLIVVRGDTKEKGLQSFISRQQTVLRTFNLALQDENGREFTNDRNSSITIDVPSALADKDRISIIILQDGVYKSMKVDVVDGKVTISGQNISSVSFIEEKDTSNLLIYIIVGVVALILVAGIAVLAFRKRY